MTIKTNEIISTTIPEAIREIEEKFGITGDKADAIASHIVYSDEDWTDEEDSPESDIEQARRCHGYGKTKEEMKYCNAPKNTYRKLVKDDWAGEGETIRKNMTEKAVKADYNRRGNSGKVYYECEQTGNIIDICYSPNFGWKFEEITI